MGMLLAITTCFYGVLPGPLLKKYPAESVCAWAMLIGGGVLACVLGGLLLGSGCLFLARHHASLGGATIVSLYLQRARQWRAGHVQMAIDGTILALSFALIEPQKALYSILAAVTMNLFIAINHRPGRYAVL